MQLEFDDRLDDGRAVVVTASQFSAADWTVGYGGWVEDMVVRLDGTGFPVSLTEAEDSRLGNKCMDLWEEYCASDYYD